MLAVGSVAHAGPRVTMRAVPRSSLCRMLAVVAGCLAGGRALAHAHVAPSEDVDNRYLKLTPMSDRVRIAYTIYIGHKPGAALRRHLDRDRDGLVGADEARGYGDAVAARIRPAVMATVDGRPAPIAWTVVDVGLGQPEVTAGAFSIDLIGWICTGGGEHRLLLRDTLALDRPGENELRLEELPGVRIGEHRLGGAPIEGFEARWNGAGGPLVTGGLDLAWTAGADAVRPADGRCHATGGHPPRRWSWLAGGAALAIAAALIARWRARTGRARTTRT